MGRLNSSGRDQDEGYYAGIHYLDDWLDTSTHWKIDCWFVPASVERAEFGLIARIQRELTQETRLSILEIKSDWHTNAAYRDTVLSVDIYQAVLDDGVRTPEAFLDWLAQRDS